MKNTKIKKKPGGKGGLGVGEGGWGGSVGGGVGSLLSSWDLCRSSECIEITLWHYMRGSLGCIPAALTSENRAMGSREGRVATGRYKTSLCKSTISGGVLLETRHVGPVGGPSLGCPGGIKNLSSQKMG